LIELEGAADFLAELLTESLGGARKDCTAGSSPRGRPGKLDDGDVPRLNSMVVEADGTFRDSGRGCGGLRARGGGGVYELR